MKVLIVFVALFALALAAPTANKDVETVKSVSDVQPDHYSFEWATSDGSSHQEDGVVKDAGSDHATVVVHGSFSFKDEKDGHVYTVNYVADENGFQPKGDHIPTN